MKKFAILSEKLSRFLPPRDEQEKGHGEGGRILSEDMTESVGTFVRVGWSSAQCVRCGELNPDQGCSHASASQIEAARQRAKENLKDKALLEGDNDALGELLTDVYRNVILDAARRFRPFVRREPDDFQSLVLTIIRVVRERRGSYSAETLARITRWIGAISKNASGNLLKKETQYKALKSKTIPTQKVSMEKIGQEDPIKFPDRPDEPLPALAREELHELVRSGMDRLKERYGTLYSEPLRLWAMEGKCVKEIAADLLVSYNVARRRIERARDLLRGLLRTDLDTIYRDWEKSQGQGTVSEEEE